MDSCIIHICPYRTELLPTCYSCPKTLKISLGLCEIRKVLNDAGKYNTIQSAMGDEEAGLSFVKFKTAASCLSAIACILKKHPDISIKTIQK